MLYKFWQILIYNDFTENLFNAIFMLYHIYHLCFTCIDFYDLSAWGGCWFDVYIRRFIYKFLNVCPFDYTVVAGSGKVGPVNQVNHTNRMDVVCCHLIDRPQSVPQLSCNHTLQFSKTLRLNRNAIFQCLVMQFCHLKSFKCYIFSNLMSL